MNSKKNFRIANYIENGDLVYFTYNQGFLSYSALFNSSKRSAQIFNHTKNDMVFTRKYLSTKFSFYDSSGAYECFDSERLLLLIEQRNQDNLQPGFDGQAT
jgi:hypothetical protein